MKRNGLRALGLASCVVAVFSILGMAVNIAELQSIVDHELIDEISIAAGLNLVNEYVAMGAEELTALAAGNMTPGLNVAINRALFQLNGGLVPLIAMSDEELLALAATGDQDAADAYVFNHKAEYIKPLPLEEAIAATDVDTLQIAYGKVLGGFYGPGSPVGQKTEDELLVLVNDDSLGIRVAAATALTTYWILGSDLTIPEVEAKLLDYTQTALGLAYQGYLAYLFSL